MNVKAWGMTAIEVMVATLLASLLMVAMLSVLRGLKVQAAALDTRLPVPAWQRTLDRVIQFDLENSRSYQQLGGRLMLHGYASRNADTAWQPTTIVYEVVTTKERAWLVRREANQAELVLAGVSAIRLGSETQAQQESLIVEGLELTCWNSEGGAAYGYRFRRP